MPDSTSHRSIVFVLGNGFDIDLGLETSYWSFYESDDCPKHYPAPLIYHLNQNLPEDKKNVRWCDLENELLNYYKSILNPKDPQDYITDEEKDFIKSYRGELWPFGTYNEKIDLINSLITKGVIIRVDNNFNPIYIPFKDDVFKSPKERDREAFKLIKEGLFKFIEKAIKPITNNNSVASNVLLSMQKCVAAGDSVVVYSFNYTPLLFRGYEITDIPVHYMHGSVRDGNIIVGTTGEHNVDKNYDYLQKGMDDSYAPPDLVTALNKADEVILFGHSLSENDSQYFEPFFRKYANPDSDGKKSVYIFTRNSNSVLDIKRAIQRLTERRRDSFFSINQPVIIRTKEIKKDQQKLLVFLTNHHTDSHFASECIGKLVKTEE